jgi:hypothetical protein
MEQRIRGHFSEAQCLVVILEKPTTFVVKMVKIAANTAPSCAASSPRPKRGGQRRWRTAATQRARGPPPPPRRGSGARRPSRRPRRLRDTGNAQAGRGGALQGKPKRPWSTTPHACGARLHANACRRAWSSFHFQQR